MKHATTDSALASMEDVWQQRAARLARRPVAPGQNTLQVVVVTIGSEPYGIELPDVLEVLTPATLTVVPGAPLAVAGVINVRGEIRPVVDLERMSGMPSARGGDPRRVLLLRHSGQVLGLHIDGVEKIRSIAAEELQSCGDLPVHYLKGITRDRLKLLRTESLFLELFEGVPA